MAERALHQRRVRSSMPPRRCEFGEVQVTVSTEDRLKRWTLAAFRLIH